MKHSKFDYSAEENSTTITALHRIEYGIAYLIIIQDALDQIQHCLDRNMAVF